MSDKVPTPTIPHPIPYAVYKQMADEEKYETLKSIAENAEKQAEIAGKQVKILEEQLLLYKAQIDGAKKDAKISKVLAILSIITAAIFAILPLL